MLILPTLYHGLFTKSGLGTSSRAWKVWISQIRNIVGQNQSTYFWESMVLLIYYNRLSYEVLLHLLPANLGGYFQAVETHRIRATDSHVPTFTLRPMHSWMISSSNSGVRKNCLQTHQRELDSDDQKCEDYFIKTCTGNEEGRYNVCLPFRVLPTQLRNPKVIASKLLTHLHSRLDKNTLLDAEYHEFSDEYETVNYTTLVDSIVQPFSIYYLLRPVVSARKPNDEIKCFQQIVENYFQILSKRSSTFKITVQEIQDSKQDAEWHRVSGSDSPADLVSQGISIRKLSSSRLCGTGLATRAKEKLAVSDSLA